MNRYDYTYNDEYQGVGNERSKVPEFLGELVCLGAEEKFPMIGHFKTESDKRNNSGKMEITLSQDESKVG